MSPLPHLIERFHVHFPFKPWPWLSEEAPKMGGGVMSHLPVQCSSIGSFPLFVSAVFLLPSAPQSITEEMLYWLASTLGTQCFIWWQPEPLCSLALTCIVSVTPMFPSVISYSSLYLPCACDPKSAPVIFMFPNLYLASVTPWTPASIQSSITIVSSSVLQSDIRFCTTTFPHELQWASCYRYLCTFSLCFSSVLLCASVHS